jgi:GrpB-like predicted nucleotidyltransferase (UPF0157 family)
MVEEGQAGAPMTDEQIAQATVGEPTPLNGRIILADPDPTWPDFYEREAARIRLILGERVLQLEHVGSTSVPGLAAKPVIDLVLVVADSSDEASFVQALEAEGYVLRIREPDWFEHRLLKGPDTDINLHVFTQGAAEVDRMIAFRDHLRQDSEDRERYAHIKGELAQRDWKFVQNYADAKSAIVAEIMERALDSR